MKPTDWKFEWFYLRMKFRRRFVRPVQRAICFFMGHSRGSKPLEFAGGTLSMKYGVTTETWWTTRICCSFCGADIFRATVKVRHIPDRILIPKVVRDVPYNGGDLR